MMFAGIYYSNQPSREKARLTRAIYPLVPGISGAWQLIIVSAALTLPLGLTRGKEYAELIWPINIGRRLHLGGLRSELFLDASPPARAEPLRGDLVLHRDHSHRGDALHRQPSLDPHELGAQLPAVRRPCRTRWCSGGTGTTPWRFFLTTPILGIMYYFLPKAAERPVYSYRLSVIHFWVAGLSCSNLGAGPHHLFEYCAAPLAARRSA